MEEDEKYKRRKEKIIVRSRRIGEREWQEKKYKTKSTVSSEINDESRKKKERGCFVFSLGPRHAHFSHHRTQVSLRKIEGGQWGLKNGGRDGTLGERESKIIFQK